MRGKQIRFPTTDYPHIYDRTVPEDHFLRRVKKAVDFSFVYEELAEGYPGRIGRPPVDPVLLFKYLFLKEHYQLSDEEVVHRSQYDLSFKYFLDLLPEGDTINPSTLSRFRTGRFKNDAHRVQLLEKVEQILADAEIAP
jgi:hypothetical protein